MGGDIKMKEGIEKIFKGFDIKSVAQRFQEIEIMVKGSRRPEVMLFSAFVEKMVGKRHYGHGDIVFLEEMIEQIKVFGYYFSNTAQDQYILFIDTRTLYAYIDWLQKLIWHLDGLLIIFERDNAVHAISDIQTRISLFMANILLRIGSIDEFLRANLLEEAIPSYLLVINEISVFNKGTLEDLKVLLAEIKDIIN
jgi:hypothetical protein